MSWIPPIRHASPADVTAVAAIIAEAFEALPAAWWLVPDPGLRRAMLTGQFQILVEHALTFGEVDLLTDRTGTAVWFHRDRPVPPPPRYDERLAAVCEQQTDRFRYLDALFDAHHPGEAHHHLAFLAVTPSRQGTGRGTALLRHHHGQLDSVGMPSYLEAAGLRNRNLYLRHGYDPHPPFTLPDGTPFYPMWRHPTGPAKSTTTPLQKTGPTR